MNPDLMNSSNSFIPSDDLPSMISSSSLDSKLTKEQTEIYWKRIFRIVYNNPEKKFAFYNSELKRLDIKVQSKRQMQRDIAQIRKIWKNGEEMDENSYFEMKNFKKSEKKMTIPTDKVNFIKNDLIENGLKGKLRKKEFLKYLKDKFKISLDRSSKIPQRQFNGFYMEKNQTNRNYTKKQQNMKKRDQDLDKPPLQDENNGNLFFQHFEDGDEDLSTSLFAQIGTDSSKNLESPFLDNLQDQNNFENNSINSYHDNIQSDFLEEMNLSSQKYDPNSNSYNNNYNNHDYYFNNAEFVLEENNYSIEFSQQFQQLTSEPIYSQQYQY